MRVKLLLHILLSQEYPKKKCGSASKDALTQHSSLPFLLHILLYKSAVHWLVLSVFVGGESEVWCPLCSYSVSF